jgi:hypothetical protein
MTGMVWKSKQERNSIYVSAAKNPQIEGMFLIKSERASKSKRQILHLAMERIFPSKQSCFTIM